MESPFRGIAQEQSMNELRVIETMRWDGVALVRLGRHLERMRRTCAGLGFAFDRDVVLAPLNAVSAGQKRVRLTIGIDGIPDLTVAEIASNPPVWRVKLASHRLDPDDQWLRIKTTQRLAYDQTRAELPTGVDELLFRNTRGELCEGTITNLFVDFGGGLLTPPVTSGLLPGVLRAEMLETGACREAVLIDSDLTFAKRIFVGNSLRGLIPAQIIA